MNYFLVTGLPRSRTLWMSSWLTTDTSICLHEPTPRLQRIEDLRNEYEALEGAFKGFSDSGLGFWLDWILQEIKPRTLIIDRVIADVEQSLVNMNLGLPKTNFCSLLLEELTKYKEHPLVLWVPYEELNSRLEEIWNHLLPGKPFDKEYSVAFCKEHLVVDNAMLLEQAKIPCITKEILPLIKIIGE